MNARVGKSSDISHSLQYARNSEKDGEILISNLSDFSATPEEQAADWISTANNYKTQCYTIVISFSPDETNYFRSLPDNGREKVSTLIRDFLKELGNRGNDVSECPYIVARHGNTDNEHYHIVIRTTDMFGKRMKDKYINKNACRSASCIALKYGLDVPAKAAERERAHQKAQGTLKKDFKPRQHAPSVTQEQINDKLRRREAVENANRRKAKLRYIIENLALKYPDSPILFKSELEKDNISISRHDKKGWCATMIDDEGKQRTYSIAKDLGLSLADLPLQHEHEIPTPKFNSKPSASSSPSKSHRAGSSGHPLSKVSTTTPGTGTSRNAEYEISESYDSDDMEERWKRQNGLKL